ncbi:hypothetical protein PV10_02879 [Exophiala mesophila]|uniref:2-dehydropantoate 2-reductase n=1 Tax=Exophiala mesophila TaxID=212818 RepID=A0A0D1X0B1_EXOME|nr:uncharacterized protein PV10_02879 [Exophiala mesophila]KIV95200.1 hypothetical protein PV10_02879 [Exophiala mesophila]
MKALIFGAGSVGCVYGYILHNAGVDLAVVCRSNLAAARNSGISIDSELYGQVHYHPKTTGSVSEAASLHGPFDYILICCKALPGVCEQIQEAVGERTAIVLAQNGIDIEREYAQRYPDNAIISGVVWLAATQLSPGVIKAGKAEKFETGTYPASAPRSHKRQAGQLSALWSRGSPGGGAPVYEDIQPQRWLKLTVNATWNPIAALTRCDGGTLFLMAEQASATDILVRTMHQVGAVAASTGCAGLVTDAHVKRVMQFYHSQRATPESGKESSMLMDVNAGRPLEVEAILGNLLRIARETRSTFQILSFSCLELYKCKG